MDKTRRSLILGASALPLVGLSACGGGSDSQTAATTNAAGRAQAQSIGATGSTDLRLAISSIWVALDPLIGDNNGGRFILPPAGRNQACLNGTQMLVCITERVTQGYWRTIQLQISGFSLTAAKTFTPGTGLDFGNFVVNGDNGTHGDWEVKTTGKVASSAIVSSTTNGVTSGTFALTFTDLLIDITPSSKVQSNAATRPMTIQGTATIPFQVETANWA